MKNGLILEGGAMRGIFSAGVLDVLMEENILFDGVIGVSAGAAFGCNYKSRQIGRVIRYNTKYCNDPRYCSFRSLIKTGDLFGAEFCYHQIPELLDPFDEETFLNSPVEFYITCTDIDTGKPIYHKCESSQGTELEWIRASASMPLVSRIVEVDGMKLLDGGISDSVPLKYFNDIGYNRNVVILTQPRGYKKSKNKLLPLIRLALRKYPKVIETIANRHNSYNDTLEYIWQEEKNGNAFIICPDEPLAVNRIEHDPDKLNAVYQLGRKTALNQLKEIRQFLCQ